MENNVENMFCVRTAPWHGLGVRVEESLTSEQALEKAGLNWMVLQKPLETNDGIPVDNYFANVRDIDNKILGVVSERYKIIQNSEAFYFTNELLGKGVRYETAGCLQEGRKVWILAKLPTEYIIYGDRISPYLVFSNTHDGSGAVKIAMTPIRVVCQNTLNLALSTASRMWTVKHVGDIQSKLEDAKETLLLAEDYMDKLGYEFHQLNKQKVTDGLISQLTDELLPLPNDATELQEKNIQKQRDDIITRFNYAPDLKNLDKNAYRFINAVSDFATHSKPLRETKGYRENLFAKTIEGNGLIDKAYDMIKQIAS